MWQKGQRTYGPRPLFSFPSLLFFLFSFSSLLFFSLLLLSSFLFYFFCLPHCRRDFVPFPLYFPRLLIIRPSWFPGNFSLITQERGSVQTDRWVILVIWPDGGNHFLRDSYTHTHQKIKIKIKRERHRQKSSSSGLHPLTVSLFWRGDENKLKETAKKKKNPNMDPCSHNPRLVSWEETDFNDGNN